MKICTNLTTRVKANIEKLMTQDLCKAWLLLQWWEGINRTWITSEEVLFRCQQVCQWGSHVKWSLCMTALFRFISMWRYRKKAIHQPRSILRWFQSTSSTMVTTYSLVSENSFFFWSATFYLLLLKKKRVNLTNSSLSNQYLFQQCLYKSQFFKNKMKLNRMILIKVRAEVKIILKKIQIKSFKINHRKLRTN